MSEDLHAPFAAAPQPEVVAEPDFARPSPVAVTGAADRPEVLVGAAFGGGLFAAWLLKRMARR